MATVEFRVRPVERFVVTKYETTDSTGVCSTIGEFPNVETAIAVKTAFEGQQGKSATPANFPVGPDQSPAGRTRKFAIVSRGFDVQTMALFAYDPEHARQVQEFAEQTYGGEWQIFEQI